MATKIIMKYRGPSCLCKHSSEGFKIGLYTQVSRVKKCKYYSLEYLCWIETVHFKIAAQISVACIAITGNLYLKYIDQSYSTSIRQSTLFSCHEIMNPNVDSLSLPSQLFFSLHALIICSYISKYSPLMKYMILCRMHVYK